MPVSRFSSRRGRPPLARPTTDLGTPELILKRAYGETTEALDLCLERGIISPMQHRSGLHLRWLHSLRYGVPFPSALDLTGGSVCSPRSVDDPQWRREREETFEIAATQLTKRQFYTAVADCCINNIRPHCIERHQLHAAFDDPRLAARLTREREQLVTGLELLCQLWGKAGGKP